MKLSLFDHYVGLSWQMQLGHQVVLKVLVNFPFWQQASIVTHLFVSKLYCGRFINNNFGRKSIKNFLTHGAILCVCGERKWTLSTTTVTHILGKEKRNIETYYKNEENLFFYTFVIPKIYVFGNYTILFMLLAFRKSFGKLMKMSILNFSVWYFWSVWNDDSRWQLQGVYLPAKALSTDVWYLPRTINFQFFASLFRFKNGFQQLEDH